MPLRCPEPRLGPAVPAALTRCCTQCARFVGRALGGSCLSEAHWTPVAWAQKLMSGSGRHRPGTWKPAYAHRRGCDCPSLVTLGAKWREGHRDGIVAGLDCPFMSAFLVCAGVLPRWWLWGVTLPTSGLQQRQPLSKEGQLDKTTKTGQLNLIDFPGVTVRWSIESSFPFPSLPLCSSELPFLFPLVLLRLWCKTTVKL